MSEPAETKDGAETETLEAFKARLQECHEDIKSISTFAGGLLEVQKNLKEDLKGINDNKELIAKAAQGFSSQHDDAEENAKAAVAAHAVLLEKIEELNTAYGKLSDVVKNVNGLKDEATASKKAVNDDVATIKDTKTQFETLNRETQGQAETTVAEQKALQEKIVELNTAYSALSGIVKNVNDLKDAATNSKQSVDDDVAAIQKAKTQFETLNGETQGQANTLKTEQESLQKLLTKVRGDHDSVVAYKLELLDDKKDDKGNDIPSVKTKIGTLHTQTQDKFQEIEKYRIGVEKQFTDLEKSLTEKIEALLPGAGAAGLASAYFEAKSRYGIVPFRSKAKKEYERVIEFILYYAVKGTTHSTNHVLFIAPLIGIAWFVLGMPENQQDVQTGLEALKNLKLEELPARFLISVPLAVISWFGFTSIQLNRRLYEEYNYKQRAMQTYHSFTKEIEELGTDGKTDLKERLLGILLNVVEEKPADYMSEYQKQPGMVEAIKTTVETTIKPVIEALPSLIRKPPGPGSV